MCSIEEAWAGQSFQNHPVQSQADLRRKYMPIGDNPISRNNDFSITSKEPAPRMDNYGFNTKMVRDTQRTPPVNRDASNEISVNYDSAPINTDMYLGQEKRPSYISIYDNAGQGGLPMPYQSGMDSRRNFNDINQAFQVSPIVEKFMQTHSKQSANANPLLNEDNHEDLKVLARKFNSANSNNRDNHDNRDNNENRDLSIVQLQHSIKDILARMERLENELHNGNSRNMYDIVLYILVGMLLAFILYSILRK
jgi:hypothetical protein